MREVLTWRKEKEVRCDTNKQGTGSEKQEEPKLTLKTKTRGKVKKGHQGQKGQLAQNGEEKR